MYIQFAFIIKKITEDTFGPTELSHLVFFLSEGLFGNFKRLDIEVFNRIHSFRLQVLALQSCLAEARRRGSTSETTDSDPTSDRTPSTQTSTETSSTNSADGVLGRGIQASDRTSDVTSERAPAPKRPEEPQCPAGRACGDSFKCNNGLVP